jgi:putative peptidoglycan lipid II flippase
MKVAIVNVCLNIALNLILVRYLGLIGLALATSISAVVGFAILSVMLKRRLGDIRDREIWTAVGRILAASVVMGGVLYVVAARLDAGAVNIWGKLIQVAVSGAAGLAAFIGLSFALKVEEVIFILGIVFGRRGQ